MRLILVSLFVLLPTLVFAQTITSNTAPKKQLNQCLGELFSARTGAVGSQGAAGDFYNDLVTCKEKEQIDTKEHAALVKQHEELRNWLKSFFGTQDKKESEAEKAKE